MNVQTLVPKHLTLDGLKRHPTYIFGISHSMYVARGRVAGGWERHGNPCGTVESFS